MLQEVGYEFKSASPIFAEFWKNNLSYTLKELT